MAPSNRAYDVTTKAALYARNGTPEYWIVDPVAESITIHEPRGGQYLPLPDWDSVRSRVVPDLAVDVPALFATARV